MNDTNNTSNTGNVNNMSIEDRADRELAEKLIDTVLDSSINAEIRQRAEKKIGRAKLDPDDDDSEYWDAFSEVFDSLLKLAAKISWGTGPAQQKA